MLCTEQSMRAWLAARELREERAIVPEIRRAVCRAAFCHRDECPKSIFSL